MSNSFVRIENDWVKGRFEAQIPRGYHKDQSGALYSGCLPFYPNSENSNKFWSRFYSPDTIEAQEYTAESFARIISSVNGYEVKATCTEIGSCHPRMWRGPTQFTKFGSTLPEVPRNRHNKFTELLVQIESLSLRLMDIFRVVHPDKRNYSTFGSEIRSFIILACTEVEAQCKGILKANNYPIIVTNGREISWTMRDYRKLSKPLKLYDYYVYLPRFSPLECFSPFGEWNDSERGVLSWYEAYNKIKHDREEAFDRAVLGYAIASLGACVVLLAAQYGPEALKENAINSIIQIEHKPKWEPEFWYFSKEMETRLDETPFTFGP